MVIDFHTHAFPDELAKKAIPKLAANGNIANVGDGTVRSLLAEMGRRDRAIHEADDLHGSEISQA